MNRNFQQIQGPIQKLVARPSLCWVLQLCFGFQIKSPERNFEGVEQRGVWQSEDKKGGFKQGLIPG